MHARAGARGASTKSSPPPTAEQRSPKRADDLSPPASSGTPRTRSSRNLRASAIHEPTRAREAGEALKKDAKSAADETRQAGKNSDTAAARGDGSREKRPTKAAGSSRESSTATGASPLAH